jgi:thiol-disulfide isomerase/thioredoxin
MWSLLLVVSLVQTPATATSQSAPTTPDGCVEAAQSFTQAQQRALKEITAAAVRKISADKVVMAKACAAQFNLQSIDEKDLAGLIVLYGEAEQPELAAAALNRALVSRTMSPTARADVLAQAVVSGLREPKSPERNARLERYIDELDRMPGDLLDLKVSTHARMNGYYRGDDIDDGIIKHSTWLIEQSKSFTPEQRRQHGSTVIFAHINMAEALAGRGYNDRAKALLNDAKTHWRDIPNVDRFVDPIIARYALVGGPAAPITAPRWLHAPANTTVEMAGAVTLLEFTAHWCGPCKESYPGVKRLLARYGDQGFRVVMATELYGYFGDERPLTAEAEYERDREYWAEEGLNVPIAVGDQRPPGVRGADGSYTYDRDPNMAAYEVGGIPQIHLIDKQGRIRLIMVGYDDANEAFVAAQIEKLLKEK